MIQLIGQRITVFFLMGAFMACDAIGSHMDVSVEHIAIGHVVSQKLYGKYADEGFEVAMNITAPGSSQTENKSFVAEKRHPLR